MKVVDYYFSPNSPWTYFGHARLGEMTKRLGAAVNAKPVDYGVIFPVSGGLPVGKRAPQRQAYRFVELARWQAHLAVPLNLKPRFFPVDGTAAAQLICGAREEGRMALAGDLLAAVWAREENIADIGTLGTIAARHGIDKAAAVIETGKSVYEANTKEALELQVFGAPTYVLDGELFWGQDRLDFLERALVRA